VSDAAKMDRILGDLADYLQHEIDEGRRIVELDRGLVDRLGAPPKAASPPGAPPPSPDDEAQTAAGTQTLDAIAGRISACRNCTLCEQRNRTVPGQGCPHPEIVFIGEGPGADEDREGLAFIGTAGQLLTRMIEAMGLARDAVWIGNIVKCRPPGNRTPLPEEMATCMPFLKAQLALLQPKVIVCLGATAVKGLLETQSGITKLRGRWQAFQGIDVMPTFHPAYLLRKPAAKREAWEDLQAVLHRLGKPVPKAKQQRPEA